MLLMFMHRFFQKKEKYLTLGMILILGLAPSFLAQGWILGPLMLLGLLWDKKWHHLHDFSKILFASFVVSVLCLSLSDRFSSGYFSWISFSWWAPWIYLCSAYFLEVIYIWKYPQHRSINPYAVVLKSLFLLVLLFLLFKNPIGIFQGKCFWFDSCRYHQGWNNGDDAGSKVTLST
jgi:hypothetical protein